MASGAERLGLPDFPWDTLAAARARAASQSSVRPACHAAVNASDSLAARACISASA